MDKPEPTIDERHIFSNILYAMSKEELDKLEKMADEKATDNYKKEILANIRLRKQKLGIPDSKENK